MCVNIKVIEKKENVTRTPLKNYSTLISCYFSNVI